jgi:ribonucleotide reductase alpha subunit
MPGATEGIHPIYARTFLRRVRYSTVDPDQAAAVADFLHQGFKVETDQYDQSGNTVVVEFPTEDPLVSEVEALGYPAELVESADEISLPDMLAFQAMYQQCYADNAVSFTVNVPEGVYTPQYVSEHLLAWLPALKGTTIMPDGTRPQAPYERITQAEYEAATAKTVADGIDEECASGACPIR